MFEGLDKETVISNVSKTGNDLKILLLEFGFEESDIKTSNNYIFEKDESQSVRYLGVNQKGWIGGTSVEVSLKDLNKVGEFSKTLSKLAGLEVYGPTYSLDQDTINESKLLSAAVNDAKQKALYIAKSQNKRLGRVLSIEEVAGNTFGVYGEVLGMGGGSEVDDQSFFPGSTKIVKNVKVKFVLR